jgi:iron complex outermembrane receptor protein
MPHPRSVRRLSIGILIVLFAVPLFAAQGRITGRITRADGTGIGGVIVNAIEASQGTLTEPNGTFTLSVPPGTYTVQFVAGEQVATENGVTVESGGSTKVDKKVDWNLSIAETITVYSASRRTERVTEAPAAVTVVPQEDIAAIAPSGQAPRVIETAPGVDFTQSGLYDTNFNTRGFNSSLNRRILTLIDGRDPAIAFLGSQEWAAVSFPLDQMQSVELIRGPGSALYGANAFSGVLNMTTKAPRDNQGGRIMLSAGDLSTRRGDISHAGGFGNDWFYRVVGGYQESDDWARSRNVSVEYPGLRLEGRPLALDHTNIKFGGLRLDKYFPNTNVFTVEGGYATLEGPVFQTGIGRVQVTDVKRPWTRINYNMPHWNFGGYYDARRAKNQIALSSGAALFEDSHNVHGEIQTNWSFMKEKSRVVLGVAYHTQDVDTANDAGVQTLMDRPHSEKAQSAYGQFDFNITNNLRLVAATRYDDSNLYDAQFSPKGALVYNVGSHTFRYGYNRAFQRPNYSELYLTVPAAAPANLAGAATLNPLTAPLAPALAALGFGPLPILARGNNALQVEKVRSHELGYAGIYGGKVYLTVDLYKSHMENFVTDLLPGVNTAFTPYTVPTNIPTIPAPVQAGITAFLKAALGPANYAGLTTVNGKPAVVFSYANAGKVDTQGGELAVNYYIGSNWVLDGNYSYFDFDVKEKAIGDQLLPNAPKKKYNLGLAWRGAKFDAKVSYRWVDEFPWAAGIFVGTVPQYDVVNLAANYRITDRFGFGADVSNVFDDAHYEAFGGDILGRRALGFVTINW